jgi:type IV pilus assembly protein PilV
MSAFMYSTNRQKGVGLIELLIALVIISIGVLAVARMQIQMIQFNQQALSRTQANNLAQDMIDRLVADRGAALAGAYNRPLGGAVPSGTTVPAQELQNWLGLIAATLPSGDGGVSVTGRTVEVRIQWDDSRGEEGALSFALATQL